MIVREEYKTRADGVKLFRTYSDEGKNLIQNETGIEYSEAIDVENAPYTYSEVEVYDQIPEEVPEDQPYSKGDRGWWNEELYESLYNNNIFNPEQFAAGWKKIQ